MKRVIINLLIACTLLSNPVYATCDFSKGITPGPNNTFIYTEECHRAVGTLVQQNKNQAQQINDYVKAISMKDLALQESDKRATLWNTTASNLEGRLQKVDSMEETNKFLYFGLGILATGFAAYVANKLR